MATTPYIQMVWHIVYLVCLKCVNSGPRRSGCWVVLINVITVHPHFITKRGRLIGKFGRDEGRTVVASNSYAGNFAQLQRNRKKLKKRMGKFLAYKYRPFCPRTWGKTCTGHAPCAFREFYNFFACDWFLFWGLSATDVLTTYNIMLWRMSYFRQRPIFWKICIG